MEKASQRTYRACAACKRRKVRCQQVVRTDGTRPACARCLRMGLSCAGPGPSITAQSFAADDQPEEAQSEKRRRVSLDQRSAASCRESFYSSSSQKSPHASIDSSTSCPPQRGSYLSLVNNPLHDNAGAVNALLEATDQQEHTTQSIVQPLDSPAPLHTEFSASLDHRSEALPGSPKAGLDSPETCSVWKKNWLVKQGWLRAEEASWFFRFLGKMTPILLDFFADPRNHEFLIEQEPILCFAILTISSEHFSLPQPSIPFRGNDVHVKAWSVTKQLLNRVIWAQERGPKSKLRTMGTVLAVLLLIEWPPRATTLPPDDMSDVVPYHEGSSSSAKEPAGFPTLEDDERHIRITNASQYLTELSTPLIQADRICEVNRNNRILFGLAQSLSRELNIKVSPQSDAWAVPDTSDQDWLSTLRIRYRDRRRRIQALLFIFNGQIASGFGAVANDFEVLSDKDVPNFDSSSSTVTSSEAPWLKAIFIWTELIKLARAFDAMLFEGPGVMGQTIKERAYVKWLHHSKSLLTGWYRDFEQMRFAGPIREILLIEYHTVQIRLGSLAIEALSQRLMEGARNNFEGPSIEHLAIELAKDDYLLSDIKLKQDKLFIKEALSAGRKLLNNASNLADGGYLQHAPQRVFTRILFAATILLKANSVLPQKDEAFATLQTLDKVLANHAKLARDGSQLAMNVFKLLSFHQTQLRQLLRTLSSHATAQIDTGDISFPNDRSEGELASGVYETSLVTDHHDDPSYSFLQTPTGGNLYPEPPPSLMMPEDWCFLPFDSLGRLESFTNLENSYWDPNGPSGLFSFGDGSSF